LFLLQNLPVTKITEQIMECRSGGDVDDYLYLDPKLLKGGDVLPKNRAPFQDAIVFVVGGGNYIEYQNLVDYIKVAIDFWQIWKRCFEHFLFCSKKPTPTARNE
jgi:hypothetical protein